MGEKEHNKEERPETLERDLEIEKEKDLSSSPVVSDPIVLYKPRVPYPEVLDAPFPSKKYKQRDDILETFKQVKVNPPLLEAIKQISAYARFLKDMCTFKRKSKDGKSKMVLLNPKILVFLLFHPL